MNLNNEESQILANNQILVPPVWHLPHGWNVSAGGFRCNPSITYQISMKNDGFEIICKFWAQRFGAAGVGAHPQFLGRVY
jgi:hypothetical protein